MKTYKRLLILIIVLAALVLLAGCKAMYSNQAAYVPVSFGSLDELKAEIAARSAASYTAGDPQGLKNLHELYQFAELPDDIRFTGYIVSGTYISACYVFEKDDPDFFAKFAGSGYTREDMAAIAVTWFKALGKPALDEYVNKNRQKGEIISIAGLDGVFLMKGSYDGNVISRNYDFIYLDQYFSLTVPDNLTPEITERLIKSIAKIPIDEP